MTRCNLIISGALSAFHLRAQSAAPTVTLPKLPYALDALEPFIDARTMEIHHGKHHQTYVDNLNKALATQPELAKQPLDQLLKNLSSVPDSIRGAIRNSGGGHANHSLFWQTLGKPKGGPAGKLVKSIEKSFGSQTAFEDKLRTAGLGVFGSGWVWVVPNGGDGLSIETTPNQDSPWNAGKTPLFGLDVWEHAYYLKYQNRRADYLAAVLKVVNWDFVSARYEDLTK
jgi:Fe-Mn family superoxide dismutase